jgi:hypothetical protein
MQQKFEVSVNLAQDFTAEQKRQGRNNIEALGRFAAFTTNSISHTVTSGESSAGSLQLVLTSSDISSGRWDCVEKLGITFVSLRVSVDGSSDLNQLTNGTPLDIGLGLNDPTANSYDMLTHLCVIPNRLAVADANANCLGAFNQDNFTSIYITIKFPSNAIPAGVNFNFTLQWKKILY